MIFQVPGIPGKSHFIDDFAKVPEKVLISQQGKGLGKTPLPDSLEKARKTVDIQRIKALGKVFS